MGGTLDSMIAWLNKRAVLTPQLLYTMVVVGLLCNGCVGVSLFTRAQKLSAPVRQATIQVGEQKRSYLYFIPHSVGSNPPIMFVLHGATQTPGQIRVSTGYEF